METLFVKAYLLLQQSILTKLTPRPGLITPLRWDGYAWRRLHGAITDFLVQPVLKLPLLKLYSLFRLSTIFDFALFLK